MQAIPSHFIATMEIVAFATTFICLVHLTYVDIKSFRIPNVDTAAIALSGLVWTLINHPEDLVLKLLFCVAIASTLWLVGNVYLSVRGRIGLGIGDIKLVAASCLWISPLMISWVLALSSFTALCWFFCTSKWRGKAQERIPFGPFIAIAGVLVWQFEPQIENLFF